MEQLKSEATMLHEFFDHTYYLCQSGRHLDAAESLAHFLREGDAQGLNPSPYFSTRWYKARYPNWSRRGAATAIEDFFFRVGKAEMRAPHPLIDPDYYRGAYADLADLGAMAPLHFMRHGDGEGRSPSAAFDAAFYRRCYLPLGASHPFCHYVSEGASRGYLPCAAHRSVEASYQAMQRAVAELPNPILLVSHDAQAAGVPILTLDLARALALRGWQPVFLLGHAGPLLDQFRALGPAFIMAEGWSDTGLARGLAAGTPVLVNTSSAAGLAVPLARAGLRTLILIHEMADFIQEQDLLPALQQASATGAGLIASMPRMVQALAETVGHVEHIRPGITLPRTKMASFRAGRQWRHRQGAGKVFVSAGYADRRKGFDLFLEAATAIAAHAPDSRFVWLGALDDWARGLAFDAVAAGLDLTLPGFVTDSLAWYRAADVYLLTSRQDPGPATAIHAAAVGTPFVGYAADIGLIGISDGVGHFVPPGATGAYVRTALDLAAGNTVALRRGLRRHIRTEAGFAPYVDALLARLDLGPVAHVQDAVSRATTSDRPAH